MDDGPLSMISLHSKCYRIHSSVRGRCRARYMKDRSSGGGIPVANAIRSVTVGIAVSDLAEAIEWYRNLLGPREELDPVPKIKEFELIKDFWLQIVEVEPDREFPPIIRIGVDDLDHEYDRMFRLAIELEPIEEVPDLIRYFSFQDPYGNRLSCYQLL